MNNIILTTKIGCYKAVLKIFNQIAMTKRESYRLTNNNEGSPTHARVQSAKSLPSYC